MNADKVSKKATSEEVNQALALTAILEMPSTRFKNKHGEKFTIHSNGMLTFISGDEVDAMVDPTKTIGGYLQLFNPSFSIWTKEELLRLGESLIELNKEEE